jgi:multicomponent Na+:H+ antiporter subunit B
MSRRTRLAFFLPAVAGLTALLVWGLVGLPDFGHYKGPYGLVLNEVTVGSRHVKNVPTAVNFDYRALDTLGEEFILFSGALGLAVILRSRREEERRPREQPDREHRSTSDLLHLAGLLLIGPLLVLGFYIVLHGHLSPGGGFQGGVILAGGLLLTYVAATHATMRKVRPWLLIEVTASFGAGGYAVIGLAGLIGGSAFFANLLPLGPVGEIYSGGTIPLANLAVSLEVSAAFVILISELLDQALVVRGES